MNDLDDYFARNLSDDTRQRVLENVEVLMKVTDWHKFDRSIAQMAVPAETYRFLRKMLIDCESAEMRTDEIEFISFGKTKPSEAPMDTETFARRFNKELEVGVIKKSLDKSSDLAHSFIK